MTTPRYSLLWMLVLAALLPGCDKNARPPTAATAATVQSVTITGLPSELSVGDRAQVAARAAWADGRSEDVTSRARWTSRSLVCLVTSGGAITANEPGECVIEASFEARSGRAAVPITPSRTFSVSGVVREKYELREPPIGGATVTIASGPQSGRTTISDSSGRYSLDGVPREPVTLRINAPDFETVTVQASPESPSIDAFLPPEMITMTWHNRTGGIAPPGAGNFSVPFQTRHRGYITLSVYSNMYECGTVETMRGWVREVGADPDWTAVGDLSIYPCRAYRTGVPELKSVALPPGNYELRMWTFLPLGWPDRVNIVSVTHPR